MVLDKSVPGDKHKPGGNQRRDSRGRQQDTEGKRMIRSHIGDKNQMNLLGAESRKGLAGRL